MKVYEQENVVIYEFESNIMGNEALNLQDKLLSSISKGKKDFCFQMEAVENIDTVGVSAFLTLKKQLGDKGSIDFQNMRESVECLLKFF